jgi:hypothetical protein
METLSTGLHGVTSHKIGLFIVTTVRSSNHAAGCKHKTEFLWYRIGTSGGFLCRL